MVAPPTLAFRELVRVLLGACDGVILAHDGPAVARLDTAARHVRNALVVAEQAERQADGLPLFDARHAARTTDPATAKETAKAITPETITKRQVLVLTAFAAHGPMDGAVLERLDRFKSWKPSTARKRVSELSKAGLLAPVGVTRNGPSSLTQYDLTSVGRYVIRQLATAQARRAANAVPAFDHRTTAA